MLWVFTGDGKGKTTAAVGQAIRFVGAGKKVVFCQFFKRGNSSEIRVLKNLGIDVYTDEDSTLPVDLGDADTINRQLDILNLALGRASDADAIVLDEFNLLASSPLITAEQLLTLLEAVFQSVDVITTGRHAPSWLIDRADLVTEMKKIKHYFDRGVPARKGREY